MKPRSISVARGRMVAALASCLLLAGGVVFAEEWHEAYRAGLSALERGDHTRAADAFKRAIARRPEPGRNVLMYGTNIEPRYYPYLHLAEALLALGRLDEAKKALETSASFGGEPAEDRQKLVARVEAALLERRPAPPTTVPPVTEPPVTAPTTLPAPSAPPSTPTPPPPTTASGTPADRSPTPTPRPSVESPARSVAAPATAAPPSSTTPTTTASTTPGTGTLEIVSQPPGSAAYVDDEPLGSTDPESGRVVKTGLPAGRHRVRVSRPGHEEVVRDIEVPRGGTASFHAMLAPVSSAGSGGQTGWVAFAAVALLLVAVTAWLALRRPTAPTTLLAKTPRPGPTPVRPQSGAPTPPGPLSPGARRDELGQEWFGDFRILELLGRGGMASVHKAERGSEIVALKRPLASLLEDTDFRKRFLREADIGRTLNHPNIIRILERGEFAGVPYFTMELLNGETLHSFVSNWGAATPRTAVTVIAQVAEALDFAHTKGVIHRDLKPSNIMLLHDGTAKVMDFGIARARRFSGLTTTGAFLGTPEYVAPETIEGGESDPRSDLYALGIVFFELLTGRRPFDADNAYAILKKQMNEAPPTPSQLEPGVPPELDQLVLSLLRKAPAERPASAEDLVVTLRDWLNRAA